MPSRLSIKDMHEIAKWRFGKCLSKEYINRNAPLAWMCQYGHTWDASYQVIMQGGWCMQCAKGNIAEARLNVARELAKGRGGKCLSTEYENQHTYLLWECEEKHRWEQRLAKVREGHWCPHCFGNARLTLERVQQAAKEHGGKCLSIKYINSATKLKWECAKGHTWSAVPNTIMRGSWCRQCGVEAQTKKIITQIKEIQKLAAGRGGKLLSKQYIHANLKLKWQCKKKHTWSALLSNIHSGTWCPYCAGIVKLTIEQMQSIAKKKGGQCLSSEYINSLSKLKWKCAKGHIWSAIPSHIIYKGTWCPECAKVSISKSLKLYFSRLKSPGGISV